MLEDSQMKTTFYPAQLLFHLCAIASGAMASSTFSDSVKYHFNPVVVTATKVNHSQRDVAASISVIDERQIEMATTSSVIELVKNFVPGVFVTERAVMGYGVATGAAGGITIRGIGGSPVTGVLVLRDGRPDIMGLMGHPLPDAYPTDGVERIEVVRGPASFLYGTNAMGGVINIISKEMKNNERTTRLSGGLGSYESRQLAFNHGGSYGVFDYSFTAATRRTDGHRDFSRYDSDFYTAHLGYQLSSSTNVSLHANYSAIYLLDPEQVNSPKKDNWYDIKRSGADVTFVHNGRWGESFFKLHGNFGRHAIFDGWRSNDFTAGLMFYHNRKFWSGNTSTLGFDIKEYGGDAKDSLNKSPAINYDEQDIMEYAPYIHFQQLFWRRFILSAGIRTEHHEIYGFEWLPKFGLVAHVFDDTSLRLSASKGFRSPSIRELYLFPPRNEELKPERMWNFEVGLARELGTKAKVDIALFRSEGENMIRLIAPPPQYVNSGEFDHTGYECTLQWFVFKSLEFYSTWSKLDLRDETANAPGKKFSAGFFYAPGKIKLSMNVLYVGGLYGADFHQNSIEDYVVADASVLYRFYKNLDFKIDLKNLFDSHYQTFYGYPMPGRQIFLNFNIHI